MSLETPDKIRTLQRKLYCKAKAEPSFRFYLLYDKICREDILYHAYRVARANAGAPGVDGVTFAQIEAAGVEEWLASLREELASRAYRAAPVRRVMIPKPGGGKRPLGIPTIRDRVVQTAAKLVLEPIFEADFEDGAYGYRPGRSATDAIKEVHRLICRGYTDVVDADLSKYFDTIPHADLLKSVARRISDRHVLWRIKLWLKAPVEERDGDGKRRMSGGKDGKRGTPQGGVASPLLANSFGPHCYQRNGNRYLGASPSEKSVKRVTTKVSEVLVPGNVQPWPEVCGRLNSLLRGWAAYFCYGTRNQAYKAVDHHVCGRVRHFLRRRHKVPSRGTEQFPSDLIFGRLGVLAMDYRREPCNETSRRA